MKKKTRKRYTGMTQEKTDIDHKEFIEKSILLRDLK
jgi:hypothetical protein